MAKFKTIHRCETLLGGHEYRVTSDGVIANIQERKPTTTKFETKVVMDMDEYAEFSEENGLQDPYRWNNPMVFSNLIADRTPDY